MQRIRVAGIVPMNDGFVLMHRKNVIRNKDYQEYYTFPGGHLEEGETLEEGVIREIKEEFGIHVKLIKQLYKLENTKLNMEEYFFLCEYVDGKFGTGDGEEFSNNPAYKDSGEYIPEIVKRKNISDLVLLPLEIKEKFLQDIQEEKLQKNMFEKNPKKSKLMFDIFLFV